jgi:hypothetical protein
MAAWFAKQNRYANMATDFLLNKYEVMWANITEISFVAIINHVAKNSHGGSLSIQVGLLIGFIEYHPSGWTVKIITRSDIKYNEVKNRTFVFGKTVFKHKLQYYIEKIQDVLFQNFRIDPNLEESIRKLLIDKKICTDPSSLSTIEENIKSFHFYGSTSFDDLD